MDAIERMQTDKPDMVAENGIAPTTPGRGKLAAPFKLVAPNADMKDIPATFVVSITPAYTERHQSCRSLIRGIVGGGVHAHHAEEQSTTVIVMMQIILCTCI